MTLDLTPLLQALIGLAAALITGMLVPWLRQKYGSEKLQTLRAYVRIAVQAAEQIFSGPGRGEEKKQFALNWLAERGVKVDLETLDAFIEAAVKEAEGTKEAKGEPF